MITSAPSNFKALLYEKNLFFSLLALLLVVTGCKKDVESVTVMPESISLSVGKTYQLYAVVMPEKAPQDVRWMSSNPEVATVNAVGLVTAVTVGECEISVYANVQKAVCRVKVTAGGSTPGDTTGTDPADTTQPQNSVLTFTVDGVRFKMIKVDGGTFQMGATAEQGDDAKDDEKPVHSVTLSTYYIGETEVTQALWKAVTGSEPTTGSGRTDEYGKGDDYPVYYVSRIECRDFITKLNAELSGQLGGMKFNLPTEAQWEYAARGGNKSRRYKYAGSDTIDNVA